MLTIYDLNNRDSAGSARMMREVTGYEGFLSSARFIDDENIITGSGKCPDEPSINVIILFSVSPYSFSPKFQNLEILLWIKFCPIDIDTENVAFQSKMFITSFTTLCYCVSVMITSFMDSSR